jgi:hypothetical protein
MSLTHDSTSCSSKMNSSERPSTPLGSSATINCTGNPNSDAEGVSLRNGHEDVRKSEGTREPPRKRITFCCCQWKKAKRVHNQNHTRFDEDMKGIIKENNGSCVRRDRTTKQLTCNQHNGILLFLL